jgi:hypothetical protein
MTSNTSLTIFDILSEFIEFNELNPRSPVFQPERSPAFQPELQHPHAEYIESNSISTEFDIENGWREFDQQYNTDIIMHPLVHPPVQSSIWSQISNFIRDIIDEPPVLPVVDTRLTMYSYEDTNSQFYNELWGNDDIVILALE